jgi:hypothetical protein
MKWRSEESQMPVGNVTGHPPPKLLTTSAPAISGLTLGPGTIARRILLLLVGSLAFVIPPTIDDPHLRNVMPWFVLVMVIQLLPVLWIKDLDIGAPPVIFGIGGMVAALGTAASMAGLLKEGQLSVRWVSTLLAGDDVEDVVRRALIGTLVGTVAYYVGFGHPAWGQRLASRFPNMVGRKWDGRRLLLLSLFCLTLFGASYVYFQNRVGVSLLDPRSLAAGKSVWRNDPSLSWVLRGMLLGALPGFLAFAYFLQKPGWMAKGSVLIGLTVVALLTLRLGQRGYSFALFLPPILLYHYIRRRVPVGLLFVGLGLALVASNITLEWRMDDQRATLSQGVSAAGEESLVRQGMAALVQHDSERSRFDVMAYLFNEFPTNRPYLYGQSWLGLLVLPIPRWLWADKWTNMDWRDSAIMPNLVGTPNPTPLLALFYVNFSWFGLILGPLLWGVFHRGLYDWMRRGQGDAGVVLYYIMFLEYFAPSVAGVSIALSYVLPIWIALRFIAPVARPEPSSARVVASGHGLPTTSNGVATVTNGVGALGKA